MTKDFQADALNSRYTVNVSTRPWTVTRTCCAHHKFIDCGDGTGYVDPTLTPASTRTFPLDEFSEVREMVEQHLETTKSILGGGEALVPIVLSFTEGDYRIAAIAQGGRDTAERYIKKECKAGATTAVLIGAGEVIMNGSQRKHKVVHVEIYQNGKVIQLALMPYKSTADGIFFGELEWVPIGTQLPAVVVQ
jgi:hypothetical protein